MTENEFNSELLPTLKANWDGMVQSIRGLQGASATEAKAKNKRVWNALGQFAVADVIKMVEQVAMDIPCLPDGKSYSWLLMQIRERLSPKTKVRHGNAMNLDDWVAECKKCYEESPSLNLRWPGDYQVRCILASGRLTELQEIRKRQIGDFARRMTEDRVFAARDKGV